MVLYYGYREWKKEKDVVVESAPESSKPYSNFEDEWNKLMKTKTINQIIIKVEERKIYNETIFIRTCTRCNFS